MATVASPPTDERFLLHNVAWETYERLLAGHLDSSVPHFTYDRGELEILSPRPNMKKTTARWRC